MNTPSPAIRGTVTITRNDGSTLTIENVFVQSADSDRIAVSAERDFVVFENDDRPIYVANVSHFSFDVYPEYPEFNAWLDAERTF